MQYEFELFENLISDHSYPFIPKPEDKTDYVSLLKQVNTECFIVIIATFKKERNRLSLQKMHRVNSLHPSFKNIKKLQLTLFHDNIKSLLPPKAFKSLQIHPKDIISFSYTSQNHLSKFYITIKSSFEGISSKEARFYYKNFNITQEIERIKKSITSSIFQLKNTEEIEHYVHLQQQALTKLSVNLLQIIHHSNASQIFKPAVDFTESDILHLIFVSLEELLLYFESEFLNYINKNSSIPYRSSLVRKFKINEKLHFVKEALMRSDIQPQLLKIIYAPFAQLTDITLHERISYKELIYFNSFLSAFFDTISSHENKTISENEIFELLHQLNFNTTLLSTLKIKRITTHLSTLESNLQKLDYLYHCLKIVHQRFCRVNISYLPNLPSLKQQLINWIDEEISYLNKKMQVSSSKPNLFAGLNENSVKIQSGLSVSQLAYFFRLLSDVGIITHSNQSDVMRFISDNFQTAKVKDISLDSIRNKFYNSDESTIEVLKDYSIKILNQLKH